MKYFLIEGIVTNPEKMTEKMMQEHQEYTGMLMKEGKVLFSSLKSDMSSSVTVFKNNVITYSISELDIHYKVSYAENWFQN